MSVENYEQIEKPNAPDGDSSNLLPSTKEMHTLQSTKAAPRSEEKIRAKEEAMFGNGFSFDQADDVFKNRTPEIVVSNPPSAAADIRQNDSQIEIARIAQRTEADQRSLIYQAEHPYRGNIEKTMATIPEQAWQQAIDAFPQLQSSGLSRTETVHLMQALVRNELYYYEGREELPDDLIAKMSGSALSLPGRPAREATLGITQISPHGIDNMAKEFPAQMSKYIGKEVQTLLDPKEAPILIAANIAHNVEMYKRHGIPISIESLAYGFNPRTNDSSGNRILLPSAETLATSEHVKNVMHQFDIITGKIQPTAVER